MNILIVYYSKFVYPLRSTIHDHLYSFQKYSKTNCYYLNMASLRVPKYLARVKFDLVIFHTLFLSKRWSRDFFKKLIAASQPLKKMGKIKIALPQDEFINTDLICDFINEFDIRQVFSVAPPSEWQKIYAAVDFSKTQFHSVLTGYLDPATIQRVKKLNDKIGQRSIDIGYRAWHAEPGLGRHGLLKVKIAELFSKLAVTRSLKIDISTESNATLNGDGWFKFLLSCRFTIGVEGGASILDRDGSIRAKVAEFQVKNPQADFDAIEAACFPGRDGELNLFALSPRHLEACLTRTCQVLVEGHYNGVLAPGEHYIELKRNFSNIEQVLGQIQSQQGCAEIAEYAYQHVVASGLFTYERFVNKILKHSLIATSQLNELQPSNASIAWVLCQFTDWLNWRLQACYGLIISCVRSFFPALFQRVYTLMRRFNKF